MSAHGDDVLRTNAAEIVRRLTVGRSTVPAGGPTDRVMRDAVTIIELLLREAADRIDMDAMTAVATLAEVRRIVAEWRPNCIGFPATPSAWSMGSIAAVVGGAS